MPTFNALGVMARLSVSNLDSTLSNEIILTQGAQQKKNSGRIASVISGGRNLLERPIGEDGSEKGVLQYIGAAGDIPLFMVEVVDGLRTRSHCALTQAPVVGGGSSDSISELTSFESSGSSMLTPLGPTTSFSTSFQSTQESPPKAKHSALKEETLDDAADNIDPALKVVTPKKRGKGKIKEAKTPSPPYGLSDALGEIGLAQARSLLGQPSDSQALTLTIDYTQATFMGRDQGASHGRDLKFEVFMNGQLVDVRFISNRRSGGETAKHGGFERFSGTRFHRQTEKPWIYSGEGDPHAGNDVVGASNRWDAISMALMTEVRLRGTDEWGELSPSAAYLSALATKALPDRLRHKSDRLGVIDVIITAGAGRKYGPETSYLQVPTRMEEPRYSQSNVANASPAAMDETAPGNKFDDPFMDALQNTPARRETPFPAVFTSPDVPLRNLTTTQQSLVPRFSLEMLENSPLKKAMRNYENAHGTARKGRTVKQRLADLNKMSPKKQAAAWEELQQDLSDETLGAITKVINAGNMAEPSPVRKLDFGAPLGAMSSLGGDQSVDFDPIKCGYIDPQLLSPSHEQSMPEAAEPEAMLTQQRMDIALGAGLASNGHLLRRIASQSPQRTPPKKTRASSLANSPIVQPVKEQRHMQKPKAPLETTPGPPPKHRRTNSALSSSLLSPYALVDGGFHTPKHQRTNASDTARSAGRSGRGANRTSARWEPKEATFEEALANFEVPELCKGSVVSYAGGKMQRQIQKARHGEFKEEVLAVGIRFVVI